MRGSLVLLTCCLAAAALLLGGGPTQERPPIYGPTPRLPWRLQRRAWLSRLAAAWPRLRCPPLHDPPPPPVPPPRPPLHNQGLVEVAYSPPASGVYLGSPSIARLDEDTLLVAHDHFPEWGRPKRTQVHASKDGGASWALRGTVDRLSWAALLAHRGALYLMGVDDTQGPGNAVSVARSLDGGLTWNQSAVAAAPPGCTWATGAMPLLAHGGLLYRSMELWCGPALQWPQGYAALLLAAPTGADLLEPSAWTASQATRFDSASMLPAWMPGPVASGGYLEGNPVPLPGGGGVGLLLRCRVYDGFQASAAAAPARGPAQRASPANGGRLYSLQQACLFHATSAPAAHSASASSSDGSGTALAHVQPALRQGGAEAAGAAGVAAPPLRLQWQGFLDMPGGGNRFTAKWDPASGLYLALTNPSIDRYGANADARNILTLVYSPNLRDWRVGATLLLPNDGLSWDDSLWLTSYQYADWIVDGDDLLAAVRTAWGGPAEPPAHSFHDTNRITFKRVRRYRQYLPAGPAAPAAGAASAQEPAAQAAAAAA